MYHMDTNGKKTGLPFGMMHPLTLRPGVKQRLCFLMEGANGSSEISRRLKISVGVVPAYMVLS